MPRKSKYNNLFIDQNLADNSRDIIRIDDFFDSTTKINFRCLKCNNIWPSLPQNIIAGRGCPDCANNKPITNIYLDEKLFILNK